MLMRLDLGQTTEAVVPMATEGVVATVVVEVAEPGEEDSEDIKSIGCCEGSLEQSGLI